MGRLSWSAYCKSSTAFAGGFIALAQPAVAFAQDVGAAQQPPAPPAAETDSSEIVITATRRKESTLKVPISVSAYSKETLDERGIKNVEDIARITPNLRIEREFTTGSTQISIRGIRETAGAATTSIYIDDTPIQGRGIGGASNVNNPYPAVFDLGRVEVLRGPQGTLFGASSEGGSVRFITTSPGLVQYEGYGRAELSFTENGAPSYEAGAALGGPIVADQLGFRISAYTRRSGGWIDRVPVTSGVIDIGTNRFPAKENANSSVTRVLGASLTYAGIPGLELTPSIYYQKQKVNDASFFWEHLSDPERGRFVNGQMFPLNQEDRFYLAALRASLDLGGVEIFSNTSYFDRKIDTSADYTRVAGELLTGNWSGPTFQAKSFFSAPQKMFTQEIRIQSPDVDRSFRWIIGGFYQNARQKRFQSVYAPNFLALFGRPIVPVTDASFRDPATIASLTNGEARDRQLAAFGQVELRLLRDLTVLGGVRYTEAKYRFTLLRDGPFNGGRSTAGGRQKDSPITPKVGLNYTPGENLLIYASAAKGFRGGGANAALPAACDPDLHALNFTGAAEQFKSDSVWSYEAGAKGRPFGRALTFEAAAFRVDWNDIQSSIYLPHCGFSFTTNLGSARSQGFEAQFDVRPTASLGFNVALSYTDAHYMETIFGPPSATGDRAQLRRKGQPLPLAPWQLSFNADYQFGVGGTWKGYLHGAYDFRSAYSLSVPTDPGYDPTTSRVEATHFASMRLGARGEKFDLSLFVDNLFNSRDILSKGKQVRTTTLFKIGTYRPRTVGVTAIGRF